MYKGQSIENTCISNNNDIISKGNNYDNDIKVDVKNRHAISLVVIMATIFDTNEKISRNWKPSL